MFCIEYCYYRVQLSGVDCGCKQQRIVSGTIAVASQRYGVQLSIDLSRRFSQLSDGKHRKFLIRFDFIDITI